MHFPQMGFRGSNAEAAAARLNTIGHQILALESPRRHIEHCSCCLWLQVHSEVLCLAGLTQLLPPAADWARRP